MQVLNGFHMERTFMRSMRILRASVQVFILWHLVP